MNKEEVGHDIDHLARILTFMDLPMRRKFQLYAVGALFWFVVTIGVAGLALTSIHTTYGTLINQYIPIERASVAMRLQVQNIDNATQRIALVDKVADLDDASADLNSALHELDLRLESLSGQLSTTTLTGDLIVIRSALQAATPNFLDAHRSRIGGTAASGTERGTIQRLISDANAVIDRLGEHAVEGYAVGSNSIDQTLDLTLTALLLLLILEVALLLLFTRWMMRAITRPLSLIQKQIHALRIGAVDLSNKIEIISKDEVGELSEAFNGLMETVNAMNRFKQVIEEDERVDEVYARLHDVFVQRLGIDACHVFEVSPDQKGLQLALRPDSVDRLACNPAILTDCTLCRALHTGHRVASIDYPGICRQFTEQGRFEHVCVPMISGGRTTGVIQLMFDPSRDTREGVGTKLFEAESYIDQSMSVIEAKRLMEQLRDTTLRDPLTGLYNRRFLQEVIEQQIAGVLRRKKQVGLIMCDLDYFKRVNDEHGHDAGDLVLKETSKVLSSSVREADIVVRFGGEEFLVLLFDIEPGEAMKVAENICHKVGENRVQLADGPLQKTISLGVSEFPHDTDIIWKAIKYADVALYEAKEQGRNRALRFTPELWTEEEF